jgi:hypothetical protein
LRHGVGLGTSMLAGLKPPAPAVETGILRAHFWRQFIEWLIERTSILRYYPQAVFGQGRDYVCCKLIWIAERFFIDRICNDLLDRRDGSGMAAFP